jgi:short-subunit dehydrogenase
MDRKRALITGSSSGIGYVYAKYLSKRGWFIDLISQNIDRARESFININYEHSKIHKNYLDLNFFNMYKFYM